MRRLFFISLILFQTFSSYPQEHRIDSLRKVLANTKEDTSRVLLLSQFIDLYYLYDPDSSLALANQALILAQKINFPRGEAYVKSVTANLLRGMGDYSTAIMLVRPNIKLAESVNDMDLLESSYGSLTSSYREGGNYKEALQYSLKGTAISDKFNNCNLCAVWNDMTASIYLMDNKLDSAILYLRLSQSYKYEAPYDGWCYSINGSIFAKLNQYDSAFKYFKLSFPALMEDLNMKDLAGAYYNIAKLYRQLNYTDSAIYFANKGMAIAQKNRFAMQEMDISELLAQIYEKINADSSLQYYKLFTIAKDSLFGQEKVKKLLSIRFNEELRDLERKNTEIQHQGQIRTLVLIGIAGLFLLIAAFLFLNNRQKQKAKLKIEQAYSELKTTQQQLIHSEKMASLGELTAGIAHEIQNPLNFVNNFSDVNAELIDEANQEIDKGNIAEVKTILIDLKDNEQKINHHGKRADAIVKGMLQHSKGSTGIKEPTDINALCDEYLRLAYHGLRAKDKSFNATTKTEFDNSIGKINVNPQDIGRVILNLINNAFYAVNEKGKQNIEGYEPAVTVITKKFREKLEIRVKDNGNGIPQKVLDKIFQPFFTTKPTGQGTGLGLSLAYDIVTKGHGGELKVKTKEGEGSEFVIQLPLN